MEIFVEKVMIAKLITPTTVETIEPKYGTNFTLEELQQYVGGYIEILHPPSKYNAILIINEEGKLLNLPLNPLASQIWQDGSDKGSPRSDDFVVGNAVLCGEDQIA